MSIKKKPAIDVQLLLSTVHDVSINVSTREIYLNGDLSKESEENIDYRVSTLFLKNIRTLSSINQSPITIHCMSPGGEWDAGIAIYDSIKLCPCETIIMVHGKAYSMASIIMQAASLRIMQPHASFMVHFGWAGSMNTSLGAIEEARVETLRNNTMLKIYAERCQYGKFFIEKRMSLDKIIDYIDKRIKNSSDWYLSSEEALYYGFTDGIAGITSVEELKKTSKKYFTNRRKICNHTKS